MNTAGGWTFHQPVRIVQCPGAWAESAARFAGGRPCLLVTSPGWQARGAVETFRNASGDAPVRVSLVRRPNPDLTDIVAARTAIEGTEIACVVALGGGSVLDSAKALGFLLGTDEPDTFGDHLAKGAPVTSRGVPLAAVPTTAGTGSEVTSTATVWDRALGKKHTLGSPALYPEAAFLDPTLTLALPFEPTAASALDALSHALESAWNRNATPVSLGFAAQAMRILTADLRGLLGALDDLTLRTRVQEAALFAGMAIGATRSALAHSISYPLTLAFDLPHGVACSFTLPAVLEFNRSELTGDFARFLAMAGFASAEGLGSAVRELLLAAEVPEILRRHVPSEEAAMNLAPAMITPSRAGNNLRAASPGDCARIVARSYELLGVRP